MNSEEPNPQTSRPAVEIGIPSRPDQDAVYSFMGLGNGEVAFATHGLHKFPAKFIPQLPRWALEYVAPPRPATILDPFCGSGTTQLEAALAGHSGIGVDINPLAVMISKAKGAHLAGGWEHLLDRVLRSARGRTPHIEERLKRDPQSLDLHPTWDYWFSGESMARLLGLRLAIGDHIDDVETRNYLLVCLSAITKACSHLSENQLKVRYDADKSPAEPISRFSEYVLKMAPQQVETAADIDAAGGRVDAFQGSAANLSVESSTVDLVVTSPPYINAVDYTMAHRYSFFILGLLDPEAFKSHRRDYIGMTERAVVATDIAEKPRASSPHIREPLDSVWTADSPVAHNRAFVVWQYFEGIRSSLLEIQRVLKTRGTAVLIVGTQNRIAGRVIETAKVVESLAHEVGMETRLRFLHRLENISSLRLNRSATGGKLKTETVIVLEPSNA